jgi:hypothetical protein
MDNDMKNSPPDELTAQHLSVGTPDARAEGIGLPFARHHAETA